MLVGGLYLPNGNPKPGPKFDYKLAWFERLIAHAADLMASNVPVVLAGDYNVMPTERDVYKPERWTRRRAVRSRKRATPTPACSARAGPTRCARSTRTRRSTPSGTISGTPTPAMPGSGSIICC